MSHSMSQFERRLIRDPAHYNQAFAGAAAAAAGATPALAPALGGVPGRLPAPVTANFCFFSAGLSICTTSTHSYPPIRLGSCNMRHRRHD